TSFPALLPYTTLFRSRSDNLSEFGYFFLQVRRIEYFKLRRTAQYVLFNDRETGYDPSHLTTGQFPSELKEAAYHHLVLLLDHLRSEEHTSELQSRFDL